MAKSKLPQNPQKGDEHTIIVKGKNGTRLVTLKATGKVGFGKWRILTNQSKTKPKK